MEHLLKAAEIVYGDALPQELLDGLNDPGTPAEAKPLAVLAFITGCMCRMERDIGALEKQIARMKKDRRK